MKNQLSIGAFGHFATSLPRRLAQTCGLLALIGATSAGALNFTWTGAAGDNSWSNPANWNQSGLVPNSNQDDVLIDGAPSVNALARVASPILIKSLNLNSGDEIVVADGGNLSVMPGAIVNNGVIRISSAGTPTVFQFFKLFSANNAFNGTGRIIIDDNPNNRLIGDAARVVNGVNHTIQGAGQVILPQLVNQGTIRQVGVNPLVFPQANGSAVNQGVMEATGSGGFFLNHSFTNTGGTIRALSGSSIVIGEFGSVREGVLDGDIRLQNDSSLKHVTIAPGSHVVQDNKAIVHLSGSLINNGVWEFAGHEYPTMLRVTEASSDGQLDGLVPIGGSGKILLAGRMLTSSATMVQEANHTIEGSGSLGMIHNYGTIRQTGPSSLGVVAMSNHGLIQAAGPGGIDLESQTGPVIENHGALIEVLDGSNLFTEEHIAGGVIRSHGSGYIRFITVTGSDQLLRSDSALDGVTVADGSHLISTTNIKNNLVNGGLWELSNTTRAHHVVFNGDNTLSGSGKISLTGHAGHRIAGDGGLLTQESSHTIEGHGNLLFNTMAMTNKGIIRQLGANPLTLDPDADGFINQGLTQATGPGGLIFNPGQFTNQFGAHIDIQTKLKLMPGATLTNEQGGYISGVGMLDLTEGAFINHGITSPGASPGILNITGAFHQTNLGELLIEIGGTLPGAQYDQLNITGAATINGLLTIHLLDGFLPDAHDTFNILKSSTLTGAFSQVNVHIGADSSRSRGQQGEFNITYTPQGITLTDFHVVPEPTTLTLLGLAGAAMLRRRKN